MVPLSQLLFQPSPKTLGLHLWQVHYDFNQCLWCGPSFWNSSLGADTKSEQNPTSFIACSIFGVSLIIATSVTFFIQTLQGCED